MEKKEGKCDNFCAQKKPFLKKKSTGEVQLFLGKRI